MTDTRTLYVLVNYTDHAATHQRGESVQFTTDDREADELLRRGVLTTHPVRRQAGENSARTEPKADQT
jgi:hypothetical protein